MNSKKKKDLKSLEEQRSSLIARRKVCKDKAERHELTEEIDALSKTIEAYSKSKSASGETTLKWIGIGVQAAGVVLPLWLTNKWSSKWTAMENGELKRNGVSLNPPTTKIPNLFGSISRLWKK